MKRALLLAWWFTIAGHPPIGPFQTFQDCATEQAWTVDLAQRRGLITTIGSCHWRANE